ncbi:succinate dehydrogenase, hydrophobic membrane anchor protein [Rappaport israeli]|uniref:succinate dehydrogenase, hydrophobic membrane anchor protein n=1 Tax=Rappaport israeli TaxID=1839807 RepID=UPI0009301EFC|nr:succinate dehydrogenase, hydrophobic membrane anchor protein [Rappaport israeli]
MSIFKSLKKVKGLGSAGNGTGHFIYQRASALTLIPLALYFLYALFRLATAHHLGEVHSFFANPFNSALALAFVLAGFYHGALGAQVVIEDYVHCEKTKWLSIIAINNACFIGAIIASISILRLALI